MMHRLTRALSAVFIAAAFTVGGVTALRADCEVFESDNGTEIEFCGSCRGYTCCWQIWVGDRMTDNGCFTVEPPPPFVPYRV